MQTVETKSSDGESFDTVEELPEGLLDALDLIVQTGIDGQQDVTTNVPRRLCNVMTGSPRPNDY